ncbi:MAG TPA: hypothetical protein VJ990_01210, partial [Clostridia bacterium]|nr:hypothetical protein [Clostridia bacterium]
MNSRKFSKGKRGVVINFNDRLKRNGISGLCAMDEQGIHFTDGEPVLLHMELVNERCSDDEKKLLMKYADATESGTITRDVL